MLCTKYHTVSYTVTGLEYYVPTLKRHGTDVHAKEFLQYIYYSEGTLQYAISKHSPQVTLSKHRIRIDMYLRLEGLPSSILPRGI